MDGASLGRRTQFARRRGRNARLGSQDFEPGLGHPKVPCSRRYTTPQRSWRRSGDAVAARADTTMRAVSAPTVVIIAAGEGTRMRSALPKVLHPLCGRPLILWPVAAAREAGRRQGRRGRQPEAAARGPAARGRRGGDPGASRAGPATRSRPPARTSTRRPTVVVINGDVPLITRGGDHGARRGARGERRRGHDGHDGARRPERLRPRRPRRATGNVERVVETKAEGDATPEQLAIREVNTGVYAFDGGAPARRAGRHRPRQRPGRALPARRAARSCSEAGKTIRGARGHRPDAHARRQRPRRPRARAARSRSSASTSATSAPG